MPTPHAEELVKDLVASDDPAATSKALQKADQYMQSPPTGEEEEVKTTVDRTVINRTDSPRASGTNGGESTTNAPGRGVTVGGATGDSEVSQAAFLQSLEEDAHERAERRKEREKKGKEAKKKGNRSFKAGDFESAVQCFTEGIKEMPWDITLYTNRALVSIN